MGSSARTGWRREGVVLVMAVTSACGADAPPLESLALRDVFGALPEVVATLPDDARERLGRRLDPTVEQDPDDASRPEGGAAVPETATASLRVRVGDEARAHQSWDALRAARWVEGAQGQGSLVRWVFPAPTATRGEPVTLDGTAATTTAAIEAESLRGRGGVLVRAAMTASGARRAMRVVSWPVGLYVEGDTVFVNAAWLVAMAGRATVDAGAQLPPIVLPEVVRDPASSRETQGLRGNPYRPYSSWAACVSDVRSRCEACLGGGNCEPRASLRDFDSAREECVWLGGGSAGDGGVADGGAGPADRAGLLCLAALLSMPEVRACASRTDNCAPPLLPANSVAGVSGVAMYLRETCLRAVDVCLGAGDTPLTSRPPTERESCSSCSSSSGSSSACTDPCTASAESCSDATSSSCTAFSGSCDTCSDSTTSTTSGCSSSSPSGSSGGSGGCSSSSGSSSGSCSSGGCSSGGGSCGSCSVHKPRPRPAPWALLREIAMTLAPLGWLLLKSRRPR